MTNDKFKDLFFEAMDAHTFGSEWEELQHILDHIIPHVPDQIILDAIEKYHQLYKELENNDA